MRGTLSERDESDKQKQRVINKLDINIKGLDGELLKITVIDYSHPDAVDFWDGNWLSCRLELNIKGFNADFLFDLRVDEIESFLMELDQLNLNLKGKANLENMEEVIKLKLNVCKTGKLKWEGRLLYPAGIGSTLVFEYDSDQTFLPAIIKELKNVLKRYPMKGKLI